MAYNIWTHGKEFELSHTSLTISENPLFFQFVLQSDSDK